MYAFGDGSNAATIHSNFFGIHTIKFQTQTNTHTLLLFRKRACVRNYIHGTSAHEQCASNYCDNGQHTSKVMGKKEKENIKNVSIHSCVYSVQCIIICAVLQPPQRSRNVVCTTQAD